MLKSLLKVNNGFSAFPAAWVGRENRESGETPERYRHCKRGGPPEGESRSLVRTGVLIVGDQVPGKYREDPGWLTIRKSGYLLQRFDRRTPQVRASGGF